MDSLKNYLFLPLAIFAASFQSGAAEGAINKPARVIEVPVAIARGADGRQEQQILAQAIPNPPQVLAALPPVEVLGAVIGIIASLVEIARRERNKQERNDSITLRRLINNGSDFINSEINPREAGDIFNKLESRILEQIQSLQSGLSEDDSSSVDFIIKTALSDEAFQKILHAGGDNFTEFLRGSKNQRKKLVKAIGSLMTKLKARGLTLTGDRIINAGTLSIQKLSTEEAREMFDKLEANLNEHGFHQAGSEEEDIFDQEGIDLFEEGLNLFEEDFDDELAASFIQAALSIPLFKKILEHSGSKFDLDKLLSGGSIENQELVRVIDSLLKKLQLQADLETEALITPNLILE